MPSVYLELPRVAWRFLRAWHFYLHKMTQMCSSSYSSTILHFLIALRQTQCTSHYPL
jgi:hypothetical protein